MTPGLRIEGGCWGCPPSLGGGAATALPRLSWSPHSAQPPISPCHSPKNLAHEMSRGPGLLLTRSCDTGSSLSVDPASASRSSRGNIHTETRYEQLAGYGVCTQPCPLTGILVLGWPVALQPTLPAICSQLPNKEPHPSGGCWPRLCHL